MLNTNFSIILFVSCFVSVLLFLKYLSILLIKFLEPYEGYDHPTSSDHHVNIKSDHRYAEVYQMNMVQKMRLRLDHMKQLRRTDKEKYNDLHKKLYKIGYDFLNALKRS